MHLPGRAPFAGFAAPAAPAALAAVVALSLCSASPAAADHLQIGAWFGPHIYSSDSALGYIEDAPEHPQLTSAMSFGGRIAHPVFVPWLVPELELAFAPTETTRSSAGVASVYWLAPRAHLRIEILPERRLQPFFLMGGGAAVSLSTAKNTFATDIAGTGYVGGGIRFDSLKGFVLRFDARVSFLPGIERVIAPEVDIGFGLELAIGKRRAAGTGTVKVAGGSAPTDRDDDGVPDDKDACPDRPEDADGFDDLDGCPDIDNDLDRVLDIADKCTSVPETYNGFQDDDGCPDTLPPEVDGLKGTVEGMLYAEGETMVRDSAQASIQRIAKLMTTHPSIRVVLIGHTDDREANQFASVIEGEPPPDLAALSADLSRARADGVKQALVSAGIDAPRIDVEGHGAEEPVSDNEKPRGRLANRRVEIKLYVPPSGLSR